MPQDDLDALMNPPEFLSDIADGSQQDTIESLSNMATKNKQELRYQQALNSTKVVKTYENKPIRLPGFVVPLQSDEQQRVTEFFIVPYFGACLHMPPPPPNQIVYAKLEKGIDVENLYDAFWFEGVLKIETMQNELGTSTYRLQLDQVIPYTSE